MHLGTTLHYFHLPFLFLTIPVSNSPLLFLQFVLARFPTSLRRISSMVTTTSCMTEAEMPRIKNQSKHKHDNTPEGNINRICNKPGDNCSSGIRTQKIKFPANRKNYEKSETTYRKLLAMKIQICWVYFV